MKSSAPGQTVRKRSRGYGLIGLCLLALVVAGGVLLVPTSYTRESDALGGARLASLPVPEAARRIEQFALAELPPCFTELRGVDGSLTRAIVAVEYMEHGDLENLVESVWVRGAAGLGMPVPDLSLGPAQIRPSTVCSLLPGHAGCNGVVPNPAVAISLLGQCENIALAHDIVSAMLHRYQAKMGMSDAVDAQLIAAVAREYNGQRNDRTENLRYRALVIHLYAANRKSEASLLSRNG